MAALWGPKPSGLKTKYSGMRTNSSVYGVPIPLIFGKQRTAGKLIWYGDFIANKDKNSGKKGGGGGSGGTKNPGSWVYTASVQVALCQGNVSGIESVWDSTGKFVVESKSEDFTIPGGGGTFTATNAASFANDSGVGRSSSFSVTANDFGSAGSKTLTGKQTIPLKQVTGTPAAGQYSVNPATGVYTFSASDAGKVVTINYSFYSFQTVQTELTIIPFTPPFTYTVEHQPYFDGDAGVLYYPSGTALVGDGAGLGAGHYDANGGSYAFSQYDAGKSITVMYRFKQPNNDRNAPNSLNLTFISGGLGQVPWSYMSSKHPGFDLGYSDVCYMASSGLYLGYSPTLPNYNYEVIGLYPFGAGIQDANPADCIAGLLYDPAFGIGFSSPYVDGSLTGAARNYWSANNFFVSSVIENQTSVGNVIGEFLEASQVGCFWSEGLLKFVPYGDTTVVGNGATYIPNTSPVVALTDSDFVPGKNEDPVKVTRKPWEDAYNKVAVKWTVRTNNYNEDVLYAQDDAAIDVFGLRKEPPIDYPFICTQDAAQFAANLRVQRNTTIRNTYTFKTKTKYDFLEPMDVITITDSNLGLNNTPVRIVGIVNDPNQPLSITAEDFPWSVASVKLYPKSWQSPAILLGQENPGDTDIFVFEAPSTMGLQQGNALYIFTGGKLATWGGSSIWISFDNINYNLLTTVHNQGRFGTLASPFASGPDPDTVNTLYVNMENSTTTLLSVSQSDADHFVTRSILSAPDVLTSPTYYQSPATVGSNLTSPFAPGAGGWTNPQNFTSTSSFASQAISAPFVGGWGAAQNFKFNVPALPILGFQVLVEAQLDKSPAIGQSSVSLAAQLIDGGGKVQGTSKIVQITSPYTSWQEYSFGGAFPLPQFLQWGVNIPLVDINGSNFGCSFQPLASGLASPFTLRVRNARMRVYTGSGQQAPELISYQNANLIGDHAYAITYVRRGIENTVSQNWATGSVFGRLDQASYVYQYPASFIGKTAYIKATAFNVFGNQQQTLAQVAPVVVPLQGIPGAFDIGSGATLTGAGATVPSWNGPFTYTSTAGIDFVNDASITWTWNINVLRNDGTTQNFVGTQTIYNLLWPKTYYFYPYLDDSNGISKSFLTFVADPTGVGTPKWAFTATSQTLARLASSGGRVPLATTAMSAATPASGSGGGGGGGGGCFSGNVKIKTVEYGFVRFDKLSKTDTFLIENEHGIFYARLLVHQNYRELMLDMSGGNFVTLNHRVKRGSEWISAEEMFPDAPRVSFNGTVYNLSVATADEEACCYILENGIVAHNKKMDT